MYKLGVVNRIGVDGLPDIEGLYRRHMIRSEDANVLLQIGELLIHDPDFVSATLFNPDDQQIAYLFPRYEYLEWSYLAPSNFID